MANIFEELELRTPKGLSVNSKFALDWYRTNIRKIFDRRRNEDVYLDGTLTGKLIEGNMYMMFYNAKTKDKLPYWDRFPLVIPFDTKTVRDGFYGLNLHYIAPLQRQSLLENLYKSQDNTQGGFVINYEYLRSVTRLSPAVPCIKRYLYNRMLKVPLQVEKKYWDVAAMLPTADFGGTNANTVYAESRKKT